MKSPIALSQGKISSFSFNSTDSQEAILFSDTYNPSNEEYNNMLKMLNKEVKSGVEYYKQIFKNVIQFIQY